MFRARPTVAQVGCGWPRYGTGRAEIGTDKRPLPFPVFTPVTCATVLSRFRASRTFPTRARKTDAASLLACLRRMTGRAGRTLIPFVSPLSDPRSRCNRRQHPAKPYRTQQRKDKCVILAIECKIIPPVNTCFSPRRGIAYRPR